MDDKALILFCEEILKQPIHSFYFLKSPENSVDQENTLIGLRLKNGGQWVCKKLSKHFWLGKHEKVTLELSEMFASKVAEQLSITYAAYSWEGHYCIPYQNTWLQLKPLCPGRVLNRFSKKKAYILGKYLAQIHTISFPSLKAEIFPSITIDPCLKLPKNIIDKIDLCNEIRFEVNKNSLFSHRDLHKDNILWLNSNIHILDWESAGLINPAVDLIGLALNCAGIASHAVKIEYFIATLQGYLSVQSIPECTDFTWTACFHSWLLWLVYNQTQKNFAEVQNTLKCIQTMDDFILQLKEIYQSASFSL